MISIRRKRQHVFKASLRPGAGFSARGENLSVILPHVRAAKLRTLGITTLNRYPILPELPTLHESGLPGFEVVPSGGYVVSASVPREIVLRLNAEINKALRSSSVTDKVTTSGAFVIGGTPEEYAGHLSAPSNGQKSSRPRA